MSRRLGKTKESLLACLAGWIEVNHWTRVVQIEGIQGTVIDRLSDLGFYWFHLIL